MPPKEKISKVTIQEAAFEMTREYGFTLVTARKLAEKLKCSTQPIFRQYENMEELREDLFYISTEYFCKKILTKKTRNRPAYLSIALSYIELAQTERNLFELIASVDDFGTETVHEFLKRAEWESAVSTLPGMDGKSEDAKRELFAMLWMFVHGLASLKVAGRVKYTDKELKELLEKAYEGFKTQF